MAEKTKEQLQSEIKKLKAGKTRQVETIKEMQDEIDRLAKLTEGFDVLENRVSELQKENISLSKTLGEALKANKGMAKEANKPNIGLRYKAILEGSEDAIRKALAGGAGECMRYTRWLLSEYENAKTVSDVIDRL